MIKSCCFFLVRFSLWTSDWKMRFVTHIVVTPEDVTPQGTSYGRVVYSMGNIYSFVKYAV